MGIKKWESTRRSPVYLMALSVLCLAFYFFSFDYALPCAIYSLSVPPLKVQLI